MKFGSTVIALLFLLVLPAALAQDVSVDQLRQNMINATGDQVTYSYSRMAESTRSCTCSRLPVSVQPAA